MNRFKKKHSWTFRYFASSPPGRFATTLDDFATWTLRYLNVSPPGRFVLLDVSIPGPYWTFRHLSHSFNLRYFKNFFVVRWRNVQGGPGIVQATYCQGSEASKVVAKRPGGELAE